MLREWMKCPCPCPTDLTHPIILLVSTCWHQNVPRAATGSITRRVTDSRSDSAASSPFIVADGPCRRPRPVDEENEPWERRAGTRPLIPSYSRRVPKSEPEILNQKP